MVKSKKILNKSWVVAVWGCLLLADVGFAQNKTPDNWKCENRVGGSWAFGVAPAGCDANVFGEDQYVWETYVPVVLNEKKSLTSERPRYMNELAAVIKESATRYIRKRKPKVSEAEVAGFVHATLALAHQESYWTHYRQYSDLRLKMMRGDSGHGHGLMQIDDRWHFVGIKKGIGWNLVDNLIYAYEQYFNHWEKATKATCVPDPNNFRTRARAAYSAYNGGASKICRWTNPSDKWARNDKGFIEKYDKQGWVSYVKDPNKIAQVNVECLVDGQEACPLRSPNHYEEPVPGKVYQNSAKELCVFKDGGFQCVSQGRDLACLQNWAGGTTTGVSLLNAEVEKRERKTLLDRHEICFKNAQAGILGLGRTVQVLKHINLRATPAGNPVGVVPSGAIVQIYDFEVRDQNTQNRYYQVSWEGKEGFIYAGDQSDYSTWARVSETMAKNPLIAMGGQKVKVRNSAGINLRNQVGGSVLTNIPVGTIIEVFQVVGKSDENELYYEVQYQNQKGFIYSGRALPEKTFAQWTAVIGK